MKHQIKFKVNPLLKFEAILLFIGAGGSILNFILDLVGGASSSNFDYATDWGVILLALFFGYLGSEFLKNSKDEKLPELKKEIRVVNLASFTIGILFMSGITEHGIFTNSSFFWTWNFFCILLLILAPFFTIKKKLKLPKVSMIKASYLLILIGGFGLILSALVQYINLIAHPSSTGFMVLEFLISIVGGLLILAVPFIKIKKHPNFYYISMIIIGILILIFVSSLSIIGHGILMVIAGNRLRLVSSMHSTKEATTQQ